jgi:hypothetical protein
MRTTLQVGLCVGIVACTRLLQAAPETMTAKVWADRTTLYPGDRLQYIARVEHSSDIEFVRDHVRKDQLSLDPFEILNVSTITGDMPGGRKFFEVRLLLTTYDVDHPDATVPSFNLFYFRRGAPADKGTTPAETLVVPPLKIGLRSTLVDPAENIRDYRPVAGVSVTDWMLPGAMGLCGLIAVLLYGSSLALAWARSGFWKRRMTAQIRSKSMKDSFEEIRQLAVDSPENIESFYMQASLILRGLAAERLGNCVGLTPREMKAALQKSDDRGDQAPAVCDLMEQCDLVRYSYDGAERARGGHPEFLRKFEELIERQ